MAEIVFWGKSFKSKQSLENFKRIVYPKMLKAIDKEYNRQDVASIGISRSAWRQCNLCHFRTANKHGGKWKAGYIACFNDFNWKLP